MHALMRRATTLRKLLFQHSCQFCSAGNSQVSPEHSSHGLLQGSSSAECCMTSKELGLRIKATHDKLRSGLQQGKEFKDVWSEHSSDTSHLSEYAATVISMAQHWEGMEKSLKARNTWIEAEVRRYYYRRHNLVALQEELRNATLDPTLLTPSHQKFIRGLQPTLAALWKQQMLEDLHDPSIVSRDPIVAAKVEQAGRGRDAAAPATTLPGDASSLPDAFVYNEGSCDTWQLHATSRVHVLDVGSCYNPLARYPHLLVTPLDLMPASQDVYKCDFLDVKVADASECRDLLHAGDEGVRADRQIERLPRNYYDVVVFSLVLDYIPCPEARLLCCKKAHQLLKPGGLLLIVTPVCFTGQYSKILVKWTQLHLARLGFGLLNRNKNKNNRTFSFRKGFFQSFWSVVEVKKLENDIKGLRRLNAINNEGNIDDLNLENGLHFSEDIKPSNI